MGFWFPPVLSSLVAVIVFAWVWALGSLEAGVAAGRAHHPCAGFLARTMLGYYDTDLVTLFFPLLMTLAPASWAMRYMLLPRMVLRRLALGAGQLSPAAAVPAPGACAALGRRPHARGALGQPLALAVGGFAGLLRRGFVVDAGVAFGFSLPDPLQRGPAGLHELGHGPARAARSAAAG